MKPKVDPSRRSTKTEKLLAKLNKKREKTQTVKNQKWKRGIISNLTESKSSISEQYEQMYDNKLSNLDETDKFLETHNYQSWLKNK